MTSVIPLRRSLRLTKTFNINLLGDGGVGKTALIRKIKAIKFEPRYIDTIGCEVYPFHVNTNYGSIEFNLYDYAGQEKYNSLHIYKSDATILMFDLTSKCSYKNLKFWQNKCDTEPVFVIGNKCDCSDIKVVPKIPYLALSAKKTMTLNNLMIPILRRLTGCDDLVIVE
jgi:GTP-binding nuclear protein Ran